MKKLVTLLAGVLFVSVGFGQTYGAPESVEFDFAHNRWLISNPTYGNILSRNSQNGALTIFATGCVHPQGLEIVNDTLYVADNGTVRLYDINTGLAITTLNFNATFLNGITHDPNGNIYVTDFSAKTIHRLNTSTRQHNIFVSGLTLNPDGIIYDPIQTRLVFVNYNSNAPIMKVNLADSTTSTIVTTNLSNNDGIAEDGVGNFYVSSWTGNKVTRFTNSFGSPTTVISSGLSSPADIYYNTVSDTLAVPNSGGNNTKYYYFGATTGIKESVESNFNLSVSPNPVGETTMINYEIKNDGKVIIKLYDIKGGLVKTIVEENQVKGIHSVPFYKMNVSGGTYFIKVSNGDLIETKKVIVE